MPDNRLQTMPDNSLVVLFEGSIAEVDVLMSKLEFYGIPCFRKNQYMGILEPFFASVGGVKPVKLMVPESEVSRAKPILEDFHRER